MLMRSISKASAAPMVQAMARSRMRAASTSRRWAGSILLSRRPRRRCSSGRMTAAAKTGPNSAPLPTSSTPATLWWPRSLAWRSNFPWHLPGPGMEALLALAQAGCFALEAAQVVEFGAAHAASSNYVDMVHHRGMDGENALDALAKADLADGDRLAQAGVVARDYGSFKCLKALFIAFLDSYVDADRVARTKLRHLALVLVDYLGHQGVLHCFRSLKY